MKWIIASARPINKNTNLNSKAHKLIEKDSLIKNNKNKNRLI